jgi:hypothetical protein
VSCNKTVTDTLASICASAYGCVNSTGFAANQNGYITATDELTPDQAHFRSFGHGVCRLYCRDKPAGFDHTQRNAIVVICHL